MFPFLLLLAVPAGTDTTFFEKLSHRIAEAQTLSGVVTATMRTEHMLETETIRFAYSRPNRFRTEIWRHGRLTQLDVSDGRTTWTEDATMAAVYTNPSLNVGFPNTANLSDLVSPASDMSPLLEASKQEHATGREVSFELKGKKTLWRIEMRRDLPVVLREIISKPGMTTTFHLNAIRINRRISPSTFRYKPSEPVNPTNITGLLLPIGAKAPDFRATMTDGSKFRMRSALGGAKATVVLFWHICEPCETALVALGSLSRQYASQGLRFVSVFTGPNEGSCKRALAMNKISEPTVLGWSSRPNVERKYRDCSAPTAYIVDSRGRVRFRYAGDLSKQLEKDLLTLGIGKTHEDPAH